jgi:hypothetical protein
MVDVCRGGGLGLRCGDIPMWRGCRVASQENGEPVPRGWLFRHHVLLFSLPFLFVALVVQFVVQICRFFSFFSLLPFLVIPWSFDHLVNILSTNEIEGQQLMDLSKKILFHNKSFHCSINLAG